MRASGTTIKATRKGGFFMVDRFAYNKKAAPWGEKPFIAYEGSGSELFEIARHDRVTFDAIG